MCEVGADQEGPVWVDAQDEFRTRFFYGPECQVPDTKDQGKAEEAFPAPDIRDFLNIAEGMEVL